MTIYYFDANCRIDYDEYDAAVVIAKTAADAWRFLKEKCYNLHEKNTSCEIIGRALQGASPGVVCASFNAG